MSVPSTFFTRQLPALIIARFDDFLALDGVISVEVGDERYAVRLGDPENPVEAGAPEDANLTLWFAPAAFDDFISGTLDAAAAVAAKAIRASGRLELLGDLAMLMTPLQRDLGWDAG